MFKLIIIGIMAFAAWNYFHQNKGNEQLNYGQPTGGGPAPYANPFSGSGGGSDSGGTSGGGGDSVKDQFEEFRQGVLQQAGDARQTIQDGYQELVEKVKDTFHR